MIALIAVGAFGEGAGFATGTKPLVLVAFAVLMVGFVQAVRTLTSVGADATAPELAAGYSAV